MRIETPLTDTVTEFARSNGCTSRASETFIASTADSADASDALDSDTLDAELARAGELAGQLVPDIVVGCTRTHASSNPDSQHHAHLPLALASLLTFATAAGKQELLPRASHTHTHTRTGTTTRACAHTLTRICHSHSPFVAPKSLLTVATAAPASPPA